MNSYRYKCILTNSCSGSISSNSAKLTVENDISLNLINLPVLTSQCLLNVTSIPSAFDCLGNTIYATTSNPLSYNSEGAYVISWIYNDGIGNTLTQTQNVIIDDITSPVPDITNLPDIQAECSFAINQIPTATDNCKGVVYATTNDPISYDSQGTYIISWTYDDGNGNTLTQSQNLIIDDITTPVPVITDLPDIHADCSFTINEIPTAADNCKGVISAATDSSLIFNSEGLHSIIWIFDDGNGNIITQNQNIIIQDDVTPPVPVITVLPDISEECSVTLLPPNAYDDCKGYIVATTINSVFYDEPGEYEVSWIYDDGNGNSATQNQNIIIQDDVTPPIPELTVLPDIFEECSVTLLPPNAYDDCKGFFTATTINPVFYDQQGEYEIIWIYDDGNGNTLIQNQKVIIQDEIEPEIECIHDTIINLLKGDTVFFVVNSGLDAIYFDNCQIDSIINNFNNSFSLVNFYFPIGTTNIEWYISDVGGNFKTCNCFITINEYYNLDEIELFIPKFFTPNFDGINDTWEITGIQEFPEATIYIYDRFGKLLTNYTAFDRGWDAEYRGSPVFSDSYWYIIDLKYKDRIYLGYVTVKR
jgi:gliding motility-associated-like protein